MATPDADEFSEALEKECNWYTLAIFLGAPASQLDDINRNYRLEGVMRCLIEVHSCLRLAEKLPTWSSIETALRRMGNIALANEIKAKYSSRQSSQSASTEKLRDKITESARNAITSQNIQLRDALLTAGLSDIAHQLFQAKVITQPTLDTVVSVTIGKTESDRAFLLLDKIKDSLGPDSNVTVMDAFLCIIHDHSGPSGPGVAKTVAQKFSQPLPKFSELICSGGQDQQLKDTNSSTKSLQESIRKYTGSICRVLNKCSDTLLSLATSFFAAKVIDKDTRKLVMEKKGFEGANVLLDAVCEYLNDGEGVETHRYSTVMRCFEVEENLKDVLADIRKGL